MLQCINTRCNPTPSPAGNALNRLRLFVLLPLFILLSGCNFVVLDPSGDVATQQRDLLIESTCLMLLIILPVMALTVGFAWRYRHSNTAAPYEPNWDHSTQLELVIWGAPLLIIICLGAMTWMGTHLLDPYRRIGRVAEGQAVSPSAQPLEVDVVALDWKWLFIYPQFGIATVNQLDVPINRPIDFRITSSSVMNSFYVPALAGQIYAMPGMETKLHAVMNRVGSSVGFSANYSGAGFSGMHFGFYSLAADDFDKWVAQVKASGGALGRGDYLELERPSENDPVRTYATTDSGLYNAIVNMCVETGKMCMSERMAIDAKGGLGLAGINNLMPLEYDKYARRGGVLGTEASYLASLCGAGKTNSAKTDTASATPIISSSFKAPPFSAAPLIGAGLPRPPYSTLFRTPAAASPGISPHPPPKPSNA
jgi:cytochrome o ubiquinol oxidase subunit 2